MKYIFIVFLLFTYNLSIAKEYINLKSFQLETGNENLQQSDWLQKDRKNNSLIWQQANRYNLDNNRPLEYETIQQRTDFYLWLYKVLDKKKSDVVWPKMAHFISNKLENINSFPFNVFTKRDVKLYATKGSETVFVNAFSKLKILYFSEFILKKEDALTWDKAIIDEEQYVWLEDVYREIDSKTLKTIDKMAKGKCIYRFMVPKEIEFTGNLSNAENRYSYALKTLRVYCKFEYD